MGLIGLLIAAVIIALLLVFSNSGFSPFNITPQKSQTIQQDAQQAVDETLEKNKLEQEQVKNIDLQ